MTPYYIKALYQSQNAIVILVKLHMIRTSFDRRDYLKKGHVNYLNY